MDWETVVAFMRKHGCDHDTASYYFALREEGCSREQALLWCGLRDPNA